MLKAVRVLVVLGLCGALAVWLLSHGYLSQGNKKPSESLRSGVGFLKHDVFGNEQVEIIRPHQEETETKGIGGFFKAASRPATASGAVYQPDTGPTTSEEASATWSGYYKEEHKSEQVPGN